MIKYHQLTFMHLTRFGRAVCLHRKQFEQMRTLEVDHLLARTAAVIDQYLHHLHGVLGTTKRVH